MGSSSSELGKSSVVFHIPEDEIKHFKWLQSQFELDLENGIEDAESIPPVIPQLAAPQPRRNRCKAAMTLIATAAKSIFSPLSLIGYAASFPVALFSFLYPSGSQPTDISSEWWGNLSYETRMLSIILAAGAFSVGMLSNKKYVPMALQRLMQNLSHCCRNPAICFTNTFSLKLGLIAALIFAGVSYGSLAWTDEIAQTCMAFANFLSTGSRRFVGIVILIDKIRNICTANGRFQRMINDELSRLEKEVRFKFKKDFENCRVDQETAQRFLTGLYAEALERQRSGNTISLFQHRTKCESAAYYLKQGVTFSASFAISFGIIPANAANGYEGANVFAKIFARTSLDDSLTNGDKFGIGLTPSIVTAFFFFVSLLNLENAADDVWESIKIDPASTLFKTFFLLAANTCSAVAFGGIANSTLVDPNLNIFNISLGTTAARAYIAANILGSGAVGLENLASFAISHQVPTTGLDALIKFIQRTKLDPGFLAELRRRHSDFQLTEDKHEQKLIGLKV